MDGVTFTRDVSLRSVSIGSINRVEINFSFLRYWRIDCKRFPLDLFEFIATVNINNNNDINNNRNINEE